MQELNKLHENIIVISVSKGGLETAIALERLAAAQKHSSIKAWINVGGTLKGTPVADVWSRPLKRFWMSCGLFFIGQKVELKALLNDLSYKRCKEKYGAIKIPSEIMTVNLIGAPLRQGEETIIRVPNDGFSPLPDAITKDGLVVVEMESDHFLKNMNLNSRMVVLLRYIVNHLN
jgi:hypothetical protein